MSSSSSGWHEVDRNGRPIRRGTNRQSNVAQGPPAMNTRSQRENNFRARRSPSTVNSNRFIPSPLPALDSPSSASRNSIPSTVHPTNDIGLQSPPSTARPSGQMQIPPESPTHVPSTPATAQLLHQPQSQQLSRSNQVTSNDSIHVSEASQSQYTAPVPHQQSRINQESGVFNLSQDFTNEKSELNNNEMSNASSEDDEENLDLGSLLDKPEIDPFAKVYETFDRFEQFLRNETAQTREEMKGIHNDVKNLQIAANLLDSRIFGSTIGPSPGTSVPQELRRVNPRPSPATEDTGLTYSSPTDEHQQSQFKHSQNSNSTFHEGNFSADPNSFHCPRQQGSLPKKDLSIPTVPAPEMTRQNLLQKQNQKSTDRQNFNTLHKGLIPAQVQQNLYFQANPSVPQHTVPHPRHQEKSHQFLPIKTDQSCLKAQQQNTNQFSPSQNQHRDSTVFDQPKIPKVPSPKLVGIGTYPSSYNDERNAKNTPYQPQEFIKEQNVQRKKQDNNRRSSSISGAKSPIFNSNPFYIIIADNAKIKYDNIVTHFSKLKLKDDSYQSLEELYNGIFTSVGIGLSATPSFVPKFNLLTKDTSFFQVFLENLHGLPFERAHAVYDVIGQHIKTRLRSEECISPTKTPLAYDVVHPLKNCDGWTLFEELIKERLVSCGARPDRDLFGELLLVQLQQGESLQNFFRRLQDMQSEFEIMLQDQDQFIPRLRILLRFVTELMRCTEYRSYLISYHKDLLRYEKEYGDLITTAPLPYQLTEIYKDLRAYRVSSVPRGRLLPSPNEMPKINQMIQPQQTLQNEVTISYQQVDPSISYQGVNDNTSNEEFCIDSWYNEDSVEAANDTSSNAVIAAMNRQRTKKFCQACLTPGHEAEVCFLRGPNFRPKELSQRLLIYNQQNGDAPPKGTVIPKWNPRTPPPMLKDSDKMKRQSENNGNFTRKKLGRPFGNSPHKAVVTKPSINNIGTNLEDDPNEQIGVGIYDTNTEKEEQFHPSLSTFIQDQEKILQNIQTNQYAPYFGDQEQEHIVIAMMNSQPPQATLRENIKEAYSHTTFYPKNSSILDHTPMQLTRQLELSHKNRLAKPSADYFRQYSKNIHELHECNFHPACKVQFQVDSGANVFSVYSRHLLIAFFPAKTEVEAVNGTFFTSNGWGVALCRMNGKQYLIAPVYECPNNPRNTFSPGALRKYSSFKKAVVDCHHELILVDHKNEKFTKPITENNGLDYIELQLVTFSSSMITDHHNHAYSMLTHGQDNNGTYTNSISRLNLPDLTSIVKLRFEKRVMDLIAYYYVSIHPNVNLRQKAITAINQLLHPSLHDNYFKSLPKTAEIQQQPTVSAFDSTMSNVDTTIVPVMNKMYKRVTRVPKNTTLTYMMLHLLFQHASKEQIVLMAKKKCFDDMPDIATISKVICQCSICKLAKAKRLPRGKLVDKTLLAPMKRLHMDFSFYTITSIRGYTTCLTIVCAGTSYPFTFPTKSKTSPIQLVKWFVLTMRKTGREVVFIRVDEDGALANCSQFCQTIIQLNCILETTGGYNSENNGMVERPHGTLADMMRASLLGAKHLFGDQLPPNLQIQKFWCFALQHSSYTMRRKYNRMRDTTPYFLVHGKRPSIDHLAIFGSRVTVINPKKERMKKLSMERSEYGHFLSFGNNVNNILYWKSSTPMDYHRAHHAIIDDAWTLNKLKNQFTILGPNDIVTDVTDDDQHIDLVPIQNGPFKKEEIRECTFQIPPVGTKIGMCLQDDPVYNLPYIKTTHPGTAAYDGIPSTYRQNSFIININKEGPLNTTFAQEMFQNAQKSEDRMITLDLVKRPSEAKQTSLSISRAMFDQMPDLSHQGPVISTMEPVLPESHAHFITSATKPDPPGDSIFKLFKGPYRRNWIAACKMSYHKNRQVAVFAQPIPKRELPPGTKVFPTKLVPEYKPTDIPTIYECKVRDCTVGTGQIKGVDFPESYCATIDPVTWKLVLCITVVIRNFCAIMDVKNAFQTSIAPPEYRIFVTCPPFYLEWLMESEGFTFEQGVQYVRQMLNGNQGTKPASHLWYKLLKPILEKYGFAKSTVDHAFFVKVYEGPRYFYICLATDDLLCSFPTWAIFEDFKCFMEKHFKLTIQTGKILRFLGMRIIQTDQGISVDQAEYLYDLVFKHYGREIENLKIAPTPQRYDAKFEKDLYESKPLSQQLIQEYSLKYKGGFRYHTGKFNYAACHTRGDIVYATQRIAEYNSSPTAEAFESIGRLYRYLAGDMLRPLFFPSGSLNSNCRLTYFDGEKDIEPITIPNELQLYSDAELARNLADRKSYLCNVLMLMNVCILIKVQKSTTIMTHTTDSETKAAFSGVRRLLPIQRLLEFMGFPCSSPTPGHIDNAALEAIVTSQRMTPRSRHLDIPIAYLQEHNGSTYVPKLIRTYYMLADIGTKPLNVQLHRRLKYWLMGEQFYPVPDTEHFKLLEMHLYEQSYVVIVRQYAG